jgi:hypothetical protein
VNAIVLATALVAAPLPQAADTVTPVFGWEPGVVLSGTTTLVQTQSQDGSAAPEQTTETAVTISIADHPRGVVVTETLDSGEPVAPYVLSDAGEFLGVDDVEAMVAQMRDQMLQQVAAQTGGTIPPQAEEMARQMFNAESIEADGRQDHLVLIGLWNGRTLRQNQLRGGRTQIKDPLSQADITAEFEAEWLGYAPCGEDDISESCIELLVEFFLDGDAIASSFEALLTQQNPVDLFVNNATQELAVRVVMQPEGMVPRRIVKTTDASFDIEAEGEIVGLAISATETTVLDVGGGLER